MPEKEDKAIEFATKEDLEVINASPELKRVYDSMKAGVTKKFQTFSQTLKESEEKVSQYAGVIEQWEQWRPIIDTVVSNPDLLTAQGRDDDEGDDPPIFQQRGNRNVNKKKMVDGEHEEFRKFQSEIKEMGQKFQNELNVSRRMLDLSLQLNDIRREHETKYPKLPFDGNKVLQLAVEKGYGDLKDAYSSVYKDDFIKNDVETQLNTRLAEELAKQRAPGETGSAAAPTYMKPLENVPKSFSEATQSALTELAAGTLTKETK